MQTNIIQHNQSKKLEILRAATELEKQGYPVTKICDHITKVLEGPKYETSGSYVRKVLPPKYKDPEQMATAFQQNHGGDNEYRLQQELKNKDVREWAIEDSKHANLTQLKKAFKHKWEEAEWYKQQLKQEQQTKQPEQPQQQEQEQEKNKMNTKLLMSVT